LVNLLIFSENYKKNTQHIRYMYNTENGIPSALVNLLIFSEN
jgi:hypothetical protein